MTVSSSMLVVALVASALSGVPAFAKESPAALPGPVAAAFERAFPGSEIRRVDAEKEGGVKVYDIEFRHGGIERECDIAADGTLLETSAVVESATVPEPVMAAFRAAAAGGTIGTIAKAEIRAQPKRGKLTLLDPPRFEYEALIARDGRNGEITVAADGTVVEALKWFRGRSEEEPEKD